MEKKSNFVQVPLWLLDELETATEIRLFCKMYNGWCLMKDADGWYYRSLSKLKEDLGISCKQNNKLLERINKLEELGILIVERNGKKTNRYKFNEHFMFNHEEYTTNEGSTPKGYKESEGVVPQKGTIYNTEENIKENIHEPVTDSTCTGDNRTVPSDIDGVQFWDNPIGYVMKLTSRPYDDTYQHLIDFIHYGELRVVREALSQMDNKALAEQLESDIDNCIQRLKSA